MATAAAGTPVAKDDGVKFTITVNCNVGGEKRAVSYTVFKRTLMSQVFDSSVQFFKLDPAQVILVVKNKVALTHKCVEDYRLSDKSVLDLIHLKEAPTIDLTLVDSCGNSKTLSASTFHPLSDVVKAFCKHLGEETGFSDLYHGGIALDLDASPASIGLKTGEQLFCYCYKAACKQYWAAAGKPEQAKNLRFIKFYFSDWKYGYKTFPIFRHDINTPMEVLIKTFCAWRGLDYDQTGFLYSYTYKQVQQGDTATSKALADGDTILAYSRQELQGRLWDAILAGTCPKVLDLLDQGAELTTSIGPEEWGKHPLHAAVANGHVELVKLLLNGQGLPGAQGQGQGSSGASGQQQQQQGQGQAAQQVPQPGLVQQQGMKPGMGPGRQRGSQQHLGDHQGQQPDHYVPAAVAQGQQEGGDRQAAGWAGAVGGSSACGSGDPGSVGVCGNGGCDPNQMDYASDPPLWHAVENNLVDLVGLLLAHGATAADLPPRDGRPKDQTGYAACPHAARKGHAETLRVLLSAGANPWLPDADGYTAYDYALDHAKPPAVVAALLEGDPRFAEVQRGFQAAYQKMCQMLKRTQRYPALGCPCRICNSVLEIRAPETEASRQVREQVGCVALVRAVQAGGPHCVEVMELLLKHGALLDGQDYDGRTALHQAIRYNRLAEAAWLVSKGAHLDVPDFEGLLPLHQAGCSGFCDITKLLVTAGAPLNLHTIKYVSQEALDAQAKKQAEAHPPGSKKQAKRKQQQLDVSGLTTIGGNSPLALAIRHGHGAIVEYLLSQNAVFDLKNAADSSAFHAALDKGSAAIAGLLLQHINKKTNGGPGAAAAGAGSGSALATTSNSRSPGARGGANRDKDKDASSKGGKKDAKKEGRDQQQRDKEKDVGGAASSGSAGEGAGTGPGGGSGTSSGAEPPVAFDAGAGLREMVLKERERLRQQLGLSTSTTAGATRGGGGGSPLGPSEPKPVLSIFARSGVAGAGSSASAAKPTTAPLPAPAPAAAGAAAVPATEPSPPAVQPAASGVAVQPAGRDSGAGKGAQGSAPTGVGSSGSGGGGGGSSASACSVGTPQGSSLVATPASSSSASPKVLTDEEGSAAEPAGQQRQQQNGPLSTDANGTPAAAVAQVAKAATLPPTQPPLQQQPNGPGVEPAGRASGPQSSVSTASAPPAPATLSTPAATAAKGSRPEAPGKHQVPTKAAATPANSAASAVAALTPAAAGGKGATKPVVDVPMLKPTAAAQQVTQVAPSSGSGTSAPSTPPLPAAGVASPIKVKFRAKPADAALPSPPGLPAAASEVPGAPPAPAAATATTNSSPTPQSATETTMPAAMPPPAPAAPSPVVSNTPASTGPPESGPPHGKNPKRGAKGAAQVQAAPAGKGGKAAATIARGSAATAAPAAPGAGTGALSAAAGPAGQAAGARPGGPAFGARHIGSSSTSSHAVPQGAAGAPPQPTHHAGAANPAVPAGPAPKDQAAAAAGSQPHPGTPLHPGIHMGPPLSYPHPHGHPHARSHMGLSPPAAAGHSLMGPQFHGAPPAGPPPGFPPGPLPGMGHGPQHPHPHAHLSSSPQLFGGLSHMGPPPSGGPSSLGLGAHDPHGAAAAAAAALASEMEQHLESSLASTVLSVVDQGLEESVGGLNDRLLLSSSGNTPPHKAGSMAAEVTAGLWPMQPDVGPGGGAHSQADAAAMAHMMAAHGHGGPMGQPVPPSSQAAAMLRQAGILTSPPGHGGHGKLQGSGPNPQGGYQQQLGVGAGGMGGLVGLMGRAQSGPLEQALGAGAGQHRLLDFDLDAERLMSTSVSSLGAGPGEISGTGADAAGSGDGMGADVAYAAVGAVLDGIDDDAGPGGRASGAGAGAPGGHMSRTASYHALSRYDSGTGGPGLEAAPSESAAAMSYGSGLDGGGNVQRHAPVKAPSHGASLAGLFSDVWGADGSTSGMKAAGTGVGDGGAAVPEWRSGSSMSSLGQHPQQQHQLQQSSDQWAALAEAQQLQLSQAMGALASVGSVGSSTAQLPTPQNASAHGSLDGAAGIEGLGARAAPAARPAVPMPPPQPAALEPLPVFPASLFDDDEADIDSSVLVATAQSAAGLPGPAASAAAGTGAAARSGSGLPPRSGPPAGSAHSHQGGSGSAGGSVSSSSSQPRRTGSGAGLNSMEPPPPPPGSGGSSGVRPMMYPVGGSGASAAHGHGHPMGMGGIAPSSGVMGGQVPGAAGGPMGYGAHGMGMYGGPAGNPMGGPGAPYGAYGGPGGAGAGYNDWYGASAAAGPAAAYGAGAGGFRPSMPMMVPPGAMYGNPGAGAGRAGPMGQSLQGQGSYSGAVGSGGHGHGHGHGAHQQGHHGHQGMGPGGALAGSTAGGAGGGGAWRGGGAAVAARGGSQEGAAPGGGGGGNSGAGSSGGTGARHHGHGHGHGHSRGGGAKGRK